VWVEQPRSDYLGYQKAPFSKVPIGFHHFFFGEKPKDSAKHVRPAVGCTNSNESSSRTATGLPNQSSKGYPNLADRLTQIRQSQFLTPQITIFASCESRFFLETAALVTQE
jgi:hypothetical protein